MAGEYDSAGLSQVTRNLPLPIKHNMSVWSPPPSSGKIPNWTSKAMGRHSVDILHVMAEPDEWRKKGRVR